MDSKLVPPENDHDLVLFATPTMGRACNSCQLCCALLPVELTPDITKDASQKCMHQYSRGCRIYASRPEPCRSWSCRWLFDPNTAGMRRPDHVHYVVDSIPDEIRMIHDDTGDEHRIAVMQVWCDPAFPDAWRDPALADYMRLMARKHRMPTLIRWGSRKAMTVFPPDISTDGEWHEKGGSISEDIGLHAHKKRRTY
jgi:hypothetical protein